MWNFEFLENSKIFKRRLPLYEYVIDKICVNHLYALSKCIYRYNMCIYVHVNLYVYMNVYIYIYKRGAIILFHAIVLDIGTTASGNRPTIFLQIGEGSWRPIHKRAMSTLSDATIFHLYTHSHRHKYILGYIYLYLHVYI